MLGVYCHDHWKIIFPLKRHFDKFKKNPNHWKIWICNLTEDKDFISNCKTISLAGTSICQCNYATYFFYFLYFCYLLFEQCPILPVELFSYTDNQVTMLRYFSKCVLTLTHNAEPVNLWKVDDWARLTTQKWFWKNNPS